MTGRGQLTSPAGRRFEVLGGGPLTAEDVEVLGAAIDRYAALEADQQLGPWNAADRPGIGARAWAAGTRWATRVRSDWGQVP